MAIQLVQEFYANVDVANPESVFVHGEYVPLTAEAINIVYNLPDMEDQYGELVDSVDTNQLEEILSTLCIEGAQWSKGKRSALTFPRHMLKPGPRMWYHFLKFRLMPSTHDHVLHKERVVLLYCIMEGHDINVGQLLCEQIRVCARRNSGGLWFPSLITQLCVMHGVDVGVDEAMEKLGPQITISAAVRVMHEETDPDDAAPRASNCPTSSFSPPPEQPNVDLVAGFQRMEQRLSQMEVVQYEHMQRMQDFWNYEKQRDLALQKHYRANSMRFHFFPQFPPHLCDSPSDDVIPNHEDEAVEDSTCPPNVVQPEPSEAAPPKRLDKGKKVATETSTRKASLRSDVNWKWKG